MRAWSAIARVIACRIHHVAYVENLLPHRQLDFVHRLHQPDVAFLNQIQKLQPAVRIFLRNRNNQPQVGFDQFLLRLLGLGFAAVE